MRSEIRKSFRSRHFFYLSIFLNIRSGQFFSHFVDCAFKSAKKLNQDILVCWTNLQFLFRQNNPPVNSLIVGFFLAFLRRRLVAAIHLNVGVMRNTAFFPMISYFLADKWIRIFPSYIAAGADLAPSCQHFFYFHDYLLSAVAYAELRNPLSTENNKRSFCISQCAHKCQMLRNSKSPPVRNW